MKKLLHISHEIEQCKEQRHNRKSKHIRGTGINKDENTHIKIQKTKKQTYAVLVNGNEVMQTTSKFIKQKY